MKTIVITKKHLLSLAVCIMAAILCVAGGFGAVAATDKKIPIYCVETDKKQIAISFDAAWGNDDTETLIKILKEYNVPATFFVVGAWVDKYPESVKQLNDAGFQIQNHSNTHPHFPNISAEQIKSEIETCNKKIAATTGKNPTLLRFPYGDYNNTSVSVVENMGMNSIQWSVDSLDWKETSTAETIYKRVVNKVQPGSIVLFHNDAKHTPEALPRILKTLKKDGYEFCFISELIMKDNYTIDHTGKQCKYNQTT